MPEMKTLNGYEVVDAKARQDIEDIMGANLASEDYVNDAMARTRIWVNTKDYATEDYVDSAIAAIPKPDYTGLATEAYVDNAIDNIPEVDLSKHALKSEVPTKVSQLQNDSKFITRDEVPETDLSEYAKKSEIPDVSDFITNIPSEYITESELNAKGYLTQHQDISGKADKNHTHPEYLTEHQSLANYATKKYVDDAIADIEIPEDADLSGYAKKTDIPTKVSQLANDSNYLTSIPSEYVTETELSAKGYLTEHQNLSEYAKKTDIPTVPTKTSQLTNDSNFLTSVPAEYVTDTELNAKGYLTQHQSLAGYATETYVDDAIAGIDIPDGAGKKVIALREGWSLTDEQLVILQELIDYIRAGNHDALSKFEISIKSMATSPTYYMVLSVSAWNESRLRVSGIAENNGNESTFYVDLYSTGTESIRGISVSKNDIAYRYEVKNWSNSNIDSSDLFSASEIYVLATDANGSGMDMCYAYLRTEAGPGFAFGGAQRIPLVSYRGNADAADLSESDMPYIEWAGWGFNAYNCSVQSVWFR